MAKVDTGARLAKAHTASKLPDIILLNGASSASRSSLTGMLRRGCRLSAWASNDFIHERAPVANLVHGAPEGLFREPTEGGGSILGYGGEALKLWRAFHRSVPHLRRRGPGGVVRG